MLLNIYQEFYKIKMSTEGGGLKKPKYLSFLNVVCEWPLKTLISGFHMSFCRTGFRCSFYVLIFHPFFTIIIELFLRTCIFTGFEFPLFSRNFLCILNMLHLPTKLLEASYLTNICLKRPLQKRRKFIFKSMLETLKFFGFW